MKRFFAGLLLLSTLAAGAADYDIDTAHSSATFKIGHLGISKVTGRFDKFSGTVSLDPADPKSLKTTAAIETASEFGWRIYAEALRRGIGRAIRVVVLGDGAPWIWALASLHFPGAIQIVDLFHALEHLSKLAKLLYGQGSEKAKRMTETWSTKLKEEDVDSVISSLSRLRPQQVAASEAVAKEIEYFKTNAHRMRYRDFRKQGSLLDPEWWKLAAKP